MSCAEGELRDRVLQELARYPDGISLPRLCKRIGVRMSVLLRELAWLGDDTIGGAPGPGLILVERRGELTIAVLTEHGRRQFGSSSADA